jgi:CAP-Gly domain
MDASGDPLAVGKKVLVNNKYAAYIRYVGLVSFAEGIWYGVELEKAVGELNSCTASDEASAHLNMSWLWQVWRWN